MLRVEPIVGIQRAARAAFDPKDETHFLVVESAGAIVVWKCARGENVRVLTIRTDAVDAIFQGDGIASVNRDGSLHRWGLDGGELGHPARPEAPSRATAIEALGTRIVTADESGRIHVWSEDLRDSPVNAHPGGVIALAVDEKHHVVVSVGQDKKILQWRVGDNGPLTGPRLLPFDGEPLAIAIASDGVVAIGGRATGGGAIDIFDLSRDERSRHIQLDRPATSISFSRLTGALAANGLEGPIMINRDGTFRTTSSGGPADVLKFSPRGELLAAISIFNGSFELYTLGAKPRLPERVVASHTQPSPSQLRLPPGKGRVRGASLVRPWGDGFVAATIGGDLTFTDARGVTTKQFNLPEVARFVALGVSDAKGFVALASDDGRAWVCRTGASPSPLPDTGVQDLAVSRNGLIAVQHSGDLTIHFMSADGTTTSPKAIPARFLVQDMVFINNETLALVGREGLDLVSISGQRRPGPVLPGDHDFDVLAVSPDGARVAAGASDGRIALFDGAMQSVQILRPKDSRTTAGVTDLAFSGREHLLASANEYEGDIRLWDSDNGTLRLQSAFADAQRLSGVSNYVVSIAFALNSDLLMALHGAGNATIYGLTATPLPTGSFMSKSGNAATVSTNGEAIVTAAGTAGAFWWKPDGSVTSLEVDTDHFERIMDVAFSEDGRTLFARPEMFKPVVAWSGEKWQIGEPSDQVQFATAINEAVYVTDGHVHRWSPGQPPVIGARVDASDVNLAPIAATEDIALAWNRENGKATVAVASREAVTWRKEIAVSIAAIAAPGLNGESLFATSSTDTRITLWRPSGSGWTAAYTVPTSDATRALSIAFDSHGHLLAGTDGGTLESRDVQSGKPAVEPAHLGNSILRVGTTADRVWALLDSGQIVFLSRGLEVKATMTPHDNQAIIATPSGLHSGTFARALFFRGTSSEPIAELEASPMYSPPGVAGAITGHGETWANVRVFFVAGIEEAKGAIQAFRKMPRWEQLLAIPTFLYGLVFVFLSLTWLIAPHRLAGWAMQRRDVRDPPPFDVYTKSLLLIHWLGHTTRAVDAWLGRSHDDLLSKCFTSLDNVRKRSQYVDLGNAHELQVWRTAVEKRQETGLWITGPGGCGKSTLAFALARHAIAGIRRPPLPVVVDTDWAGSRLDSDKAGSLLDYVRQQLSVGERWMTPTMLAGLARRGRIILVVDGLSERRVADAKDQVIRAWTSGVLRYLIVASRDEAPEQAHQMREVRVGPLTVELLPAFAREYIAEEIVDSAVQQLAKLANEQGIRPLFAKLALERIAAGKALPTNYPRLVHEYVVALRPRDSHSLALEDFLLAARVCAFSVVDEHLAPTQVSPDYMRARLNEAKFVTDEEKPSEVSAAGCINQLVTCGLLDRVEADGAILLRFSFDLIAEYLAAMEVVHRPTLERNAMLRQKIMDAPPSSALREALDLVEETKPAA